MPSESAFNLLKAFPFVALRIFWLVRIIEEIKNLSREGFDNPIGGIMKPRIGIRPTIDGRRGPMKLRESLEDQTMALAKAAKALFEENLRYSDGTPVEVVIADTTIGRVPETAACEEKFRKENVAVTLTVTPCWCYGAETMDMDPLTIKGVWGFNGTERPGAVYLASVLATHAQKGLPAFGIYGHEVQDASQVGEIPEDVKEKLLRFGRAALAVAQMRGKSYLQIGSQCMGIGGSIIDHDFMESYLGLRVESVDEVEILRRMEEGIYVQEDYEKALAWTKKHCLEGRDDNPDFVRFSDEEKKKQWEFTVKMYLIVKDLILGNKRLPERFKEEQSGHNAIAAGFQGQRQWTDHWPNGDYVEAILNSTFDYEGKKEPIILATENDTLNGIGMLFEKLLTGRASIFADIRTYWSGAATKRVTGYEFEGKAKDSDGIIHLLNSGAACLDATGVCKENGKPAMKKWWEVTDEDIEKMTAATRWCEAGFDNFRGGGFSSSYTTREEMPATIVRLNIVKGLGPVLQLVEGWTVHLPEKVSDALMERTNPTWPCTWFAPRCDHRPGSPFNTAYDVMNSWGANHGAIVYGHIGADILTLCSMLRIPVSMHNVAPEKIFRPAAWSLFGMDKEGQDYRACETYGPLYKNMRK